MQNISLKVRSFTSTKRKLQIDLIDQIDSFCAVLDPFSGDHGVNNENVIALVARNFVWPDGQGTPLLSRGKRRGR